MALAGATSAWAHEGGHGPLISGKGPGGGRLAAVVAASEAGLGENAKPLALVEWKREGKRVEVAFLDLSRKALPTKAAGDLKWILLGPPGSKAEVVVTALTLSQKSVAQELSLATVKTVEVIIPEGAISPGKTVAVFPLN
jgi:hypothetical protein